MRRLKKWTSLVLANALAAAALLTGCSTSNTSKGVVAESTKSGSSATSSSTGNSSSVAGETIKVLFKGPKLDRWDAVYQKYLDETKDSLNIELDMTWVEHADYKEKLNLVMLGGDDYDLVFEASWVHLKEFAAENYYADLSTYFNNDEYPGLKKAFSEDLMESNKWYGSMCYIPLLTTYGNGVGCIYYRSDWAKEWGIGTDGKINDIDEMVSYWQTAKDNGILPYSTGSNRGFFQIGTVGGGYPAAAKLGITAYQIGGVMYWVYVKDDKVQAVAMEGSGDENFKDFPAPFNYDFGVDRYQDFADWQQAGYISADSMAITDGETPFYVSAAASMIKTVDEQPTVFSKVATYTPDAKVDYFVYDEGCREMKEGAISTTFGANNGLAVPATSTRVDTTMKFLDWMFGEESHHDLFELGIEGEDWVSAGDNQFEALTDYNATFPIYGFTINPTYTKFSNLYTAEAMEYMRWQLEDSTFVKAPLSGFNFNGTSTEVTTLAAQVKAITDKIATTKMHGILSDGTTTYATADEMLKANVDEAVAAGADKLQEALVGQIEEFLASK